MLDWFFFPLRISTITALTLENARMMRHMWETMRVWMRLLSFMELRAEEEGAGCEVLRWEDGQGMFVLFVCCLCVSVGDSGVRREWCI